jgi:hypothetical protein
MHWKSTSVRIAIILLACCVVGAVAALIDFGPEGMGHGALGGLVVAVPIALVIPFWGKPLIGFAGGGLSGAIAGIVLSITFGPFTYKNEGFAAFAGGASAELVAATYIGFLVGAIGGAILVKCSPMRT